MTLPTMNPALERAIAARAYTELTAVQNAVLEARATGQDLLVSAQTGSGKTVAFGMAMATRILGESERFDRAAEPLALIIAPTRELAMQVQRELEWLYAETGAKIATCVGGMDPKTERIALAAGAHIVVGTPGRLRDHLERRRLDTSKLRTVVLDEADEMLDLGFRDDLQFILDTTPADRQTLMFSATVPREIEALARSYQRDAIRIETASRNQAHADIEYRAIRIPPATIEATVVNLLRYFDARATLVFCATREGVRLMHQGLVDRGFACVALSGELSQAERTQALESLREGNAKVLVATDVAARGLDLPELTLVIHADLPNDRETLLHRSGRTGRAGRKGISILVVPPNRRRKAETLISAARIEAEWGAAPTAKQIAAKDQERLLEMPVLDELATAEDLALGRTLLEGRTPEQLAAALVRFHRASLPVPVDIRAMPVERNDRLPPKGTLAERKPWIRDREERNDRTPRAPSDLNSYARPPRENPSREGMVWFGLNIGREKNADPRWLLPLICRVGDVSKKEIGSIKIADRETTFEILESHADQFALAVKVSKNKEGKIWRMDGKEPPVQAGADDARPHVSKPYKPKPRIKQLPDAPSIDARSNVAEPVIVDENRSTPDVVELHAMPVAEANASIASPVDQHAPTAAVTSASTSDVPSDVTSDANPVTPASDTLDRPAVPAAEKPKHFSDGSIGLKNRATRDTGGKRPDSKHPDAKHPDSKYPVSPPSSTDNSATDAKPRPIKPWAAKSHDDRPRDANERKKPAHGRDDAPRSPRVDAKPDGKPWRKRNGDGAPDVGKPHRDAKPFKPYSSDRSTAPRSADAAPARGWTPNTGHAARPESRDAGRTGDTRHTGSAPAKPWAAKSRDFKPREPRSADVGPREQRASESKPWAKRPAGATAKPYDSAKPRSDDRSSSPRGDSRSATPLSLKPRSDGERTTSRPDHKREFKTEFKRAGEGTASKSSGAKPWAGKSRDAKPWQKRPAGGVTEAARKPFHASKKFGGGKPSIKSKG